MLSSGIRSGSCWNCPPTRGSARKGQLTIKYNKQNYRIPQMKLLKYIMLIGAVCGAFTLQPAKADIMSTLNVGNDDLNNFPGPYGTVTIGLSGQVATITFKAAAGFEFGD